MGAYLVLVEFYFASKERRLLGCNHWMTTRHPELGAHHTDPNIRLPFHHYEGMAACFDLPLSSKNAILAQTLCPAHPEIVRREQRQAWPIRSVLTIWCFWRTICMLFGVSPFCLWSRPCLFEFGTSLHPCDCQRAALVLLPYLTTQHTLAENTVAALVW